MMNRPDNTTAKAASEGVGFWDRLRQRWFGDRSGHPAASVKVWDRNRGCYRYVNLDDRSDPLWSAAWSLANFHQQNDTRRPAA